MEVLLYNKSSKTSAKIAYPGIWPNEIKGLDSDLVIYEIEYQPKPEYNPNELKLIETKPNLTTKKGVVYNIAKIDWGLVEIGNVVERLNTSFGSWIDEVYPIYKRTNDASIEPSEQGNLRISRYKELRADREQRELKYINENIFPSFEWEW